MDLFCAARAWLNTVLQCSCDWFTLLYRLLGAQGPWSTGRKGRTKWNASRALSHSIESARESCRVISQW